MICPSRRGFADETAITLFSAQDPRLGAIPAAGKGLALTYKWIASEVKKKEAVELAVAGD
jgi:hypothetical protein